MAVISKLSDIIKLIPTARSEFFQSPIASVDDETIACNPLYAVLVNKSTNSIFHIFRVVFLIIRVTGGFRLLLSNLSKEAKSTIDFVKSDREVMFKGDWPFKNDGDGLYIETFNGYKAYFCTDYDDMFEIRSRLKARITTPSTQTASVERIVYTETVFV